MPGHKPISRLKPLFERGDARNAQALPAENGRILVERCTQMPCGCHARCVLAPGECVWGVAGPNPYVAETFIWYTWEEHTPACKDLLPEDN